MAARHSAVTGGAGFIGHHLVRLGLPQRPVRRALAEAIAWLADHGHLRRRPIIRSAAVASPAGRSASFASPDEIDTADR